MSDLLHEIKDHCEEAEENYYLTPEVEESAEQHSENIGSEKGMFRAMFRIYTAIAFQAFADRRYPAAYTMFQLIESYMPTVCAELVFGYVGPYWDNETLVMVRDSSHPGYYTVAYITVSTAPEEKLDPHEIKYFVCEQSEYKQMHDSRSEISSMVLAHLMEDRKDEKVECNFTFIKKMPRDITRLTVLNSITDGKIAYGLATGHYGNCYISCGPRVPRSRSQSSSISTVMSSSSQSNLSNAYVPSTSTQYPSQSSSLQSNSSLSSLTNAYVPSTSSVLTSDSSLQTTPTIFSSRNLSHCSLPLDRQDSYPQTNMVLQRTQSVTSYLSNESFHPNFGGVISRQHEQKQNQNSSVCPLLGGDHHGTDWQQPVTRRYSEPIHRSNPTVVQVRRIVSEQYNRSGIVHRQSYEQSVSYPPYQVLPQYQQQLQNSPLPCQYQQQLQNSPLPCQYQQQLQNSPLPRQYPQQQNSPLPRQYPQQQNSPLPSQYRPQQNSQLLHQYQQQQNSQLLHQYPQQQNSQLPQQYQWQPQNSQLTHQYPPQQNSQLPQQYQWQPQNSPLPQQYPQQPHFQHHNTH